MSEKKPVGRPRLGAKKRKMICISLDPLVLKELDREAKFSGDTRSETARLAIEKFLSARKKSRALLGLG